MYKPSLLTALYAEHEDASQKFLQARNHDAEDAERYLKRMERIAKNIEYTVQMMDGTIGKMPMPHGAARTV